MIYLFLELILLKYDIQLLTDLKRKTPQDPSLCEFVYSVAMTAPTSLKRKLPENLFKHIKSEKAIKRFIGSSSFDQKKEFLGYMGYKSCFIISNVDNVWMPEMKREFKKLEKRNPEKSFKEIFENDFYVTTDKNLVAFLDMAARATDSPVYSMQMEMLRINKGVERWSPKLNNPQLEKYKADQKEWDDFIIITLLACRDLINSHTMFDRTQCQMMLLLLLYVNRNSYTSHEELISIFCGVLSKKDISLSVRVLLEDLMVHKSFDRTKREYIITASGMIKVFEFRNKLYQSFALNKRLIPAQPLAEAV